MAGAQASDPDGTSAPPRRARRRGQRAVGRGSVRTRRPPLTCRRRRRPRATHWRRTPPRGARSRPGQSRRRDFPAQWRASL
eukprot:6118392-Pleurochrysis_carterae.AAC.4